MNKKKLVNITLFFAFLFLFIPSVKSASIDFYIGKSSCNVRKGPGTNHEVILSGSDPVQIRAGQDLTFLNKSTGYNASQQGDWYGIMFDYAAREYTGYVWNGCVNIVKKTYFDDTVFEASLLEQKFPESYKPYIRKLHALHPNWLFRADHTGLNWSESIEAQSQKGSSAIDGRNYSSLVFRDELNPNGIVVDGTSWYAPARDAVGYFMDPRNFLIERNVFMFEKLSFNTAQTENMVQTILAGTFMAGTFTENGITKSYATAFLEAARDSGVSATFLAARAKQELGSNNGVASCGTIEGYEGIYNFYNIGATSGSNNVYKGLEYAKTSGHYDRPWNSIQKSITGGAKLIGGGYITAGQDSLYFQKFNTSSFRTRKQHTHQYMTNIMAPQTESISLFNSYNNNGRINNSIIFTIPVYNNMPASAYKVSRIDTVGGTPDPGNPIEGAPTEIPTTSAEKYVTKAGYRLSGNYVAGLTYKIDSSSINSKLLSLGASASILNNAGANKPSGKIATGDIININNKQYKAVIYGDVVPDGEITIADLLRVQKVLLGASTIEGEFKEAADVTKDGKITIADLLRMQKHLLGALVIEQ